MACTNPRIMAVVDTSGFKRTTPDGVIVPDFTTIERLKRHNWKISYEHKRAYRLIAKESRDLPLEDIPSWARMEDMEIPCGNCVQCRLDYSKNWATRCYLESLNYDHNYFVTLTYDDDHIKRSSKTDNPTVCVDDFRKFIKKLRQVMFRKFGHTGIKYFGCTEYGDQSFRPHGHIILFNCPIPDLSINFKDDDGNISQHKSSFGFMYYSDLLKSLWPYGFITVEDANYNTEAYVSRYIMKKQKGKAGVELYSKNLDIEAPRLFMSLNIGGQYFEDHEEELIDNPSLIVPRGSGQAPLISGLPRYYKNKISKRHPEDYDRMISVAKDNTLKARSLLRGKQLMNDNRAAKENHIKRSFEAFSRDL